jgi:hypothetical protein
MKKTYLKPEIEDLYMQSEMIAASTMDLIDATPVSTEDILTRETVFEFPFE